MTQHFSLPTTIVALVFAAAPIYAAGSPQQKCQAAKNQAAGKYAACRQNAEKGLALGTDSVTYDAALAKGATKLASAWSKAETKASAARGTCVDAPLMVSDYLPILAADSDNIAAALGGAALRDCDSDLAACQASRIGCTTDLATCQSGTATTADVLAGKTFSSHVGSAIGGTITNHGPANFTPSSSPQTIAAGCYGGGQVNGDANLVAGNIVAGVDLFGVTGSLIAASGNAIAAQVRSGATFSNATSSGIAGTMPDVGQQDIIPGPAPITILQGYHDGSGMVAGDTDLLAGNIRAGVDQIASIKAVFETSWNPLSDAGEIFLVSHLDAHAHVRQRVARHHPPPIGSKPQERRRVQAIRPDRMNNSLGRGAIATPEGARPRDYPESPREIG